MLVAPTTGAWIETLIDLYKNQEGGCRSHHGSVD